MGLPPVRTSGAVGLGGPAAGIPGSAEGGRSARARQRAAAAAAGAAGDAGQGMMGILGEPQPLTLPPINLEETLASAAASLEKLVGPDGTPTFTLDPATLAALTQGLTALTAPPGSATASGSAGLGQLPSLLSPLAVGPGGSGPFAYGLGSPGAPGLFPPAGQGPGSGSGPMPMMVGGPGSPGMGLGALAAGLGPMPGLSPGLPPISTRMGGYRPPGGASLRRRRRKPQPERPPPGVSPTMLALTNGTPQQQLRANLFGPLSSPSPAMPAQLFATTAGDTAAAGVPAPAGAGAAVQGEAGAATGGAAAGSTGAAGAEPSAAAAPAAAGGAEAAGAGAGAADGAAAAETAAGASAAAAAATAAAAAELEGALSHCLRSSRFRRWVTAEWHYSAIDRPWFMRNELAELMGTLGLSHVTKLARGEWALLRGSFGKPRRLSLAFLKEERMKLEAWRWVAFYAGVLFPDGQWVQGACVGMCGEGGAWPGECNMCNARLSPETWTIALPQGAREAQV